MMNHVLDQLRAAGVNPQLNYLRRGGMTIVRWLQLKLSNEVVEEVRKLLGTKFLRPSFPAPRAWPKPRVSENQLSTTINTGSGAAAYQLLTAEIINRLSEIQ